VSRTVRTSARIAFTRFQYSSDERFSTCRVLPVTSSLDLKIWKPSARKDILKVSCRGSYYFFYPLILKIAYILPCARM